MRCKNCKKENKQIKTGKIRAGIQLYKCKHCGKRNTPNPKERSYSKEIRRQTIKLYMEGNSGRAVGMILGISKNTCLYWIRKYAKEIGEKNVSNERVKVIEMDELYTFSERKNKIYVITLVNREKKQIVGYDIAFDKNRERIQKLVDSSPKAEYYYSDAYSAYDEVCYFGMHTSLKNKSQTYTVECLNSDLRHYIPLLRRKSKCFFCSIDTAKAVFKIFIHAFNNFALAKFLHPSLKSSLSLFCLLYISLIWYFPNLEKSITQNERDSYWQK